MTDLRVSVCTDPIQFEALKEEWSRLLDLSSVQSVFLSWHWLYAWWSKYNTSHMLHIVMVRDASSGVLVGLGPFCVDENQGWWRPKALVFLGSSAVSSEYLDIIADPYREEEVANTIFTFLCHQSPAWDLLIFDDMLKTSVVARYISASALKDTHIVKENVSEICPYITLPDSKAAMLGDLSSRLRSTIKRQGKKLKAAGAVIRKAEDPAELTPYLEGLFSLHQKRWNAVGVKGSFEGQVIREFHTVVAKTFLDNDMLRLYIMQLNGHIIAALYAFQYKGSWFYFQSGYDPEWSGYSPGSVLMWHCIADAIDQGGAEFDYLRGNESYKHLWSSQSRQTCTLLCIPLKSFKLRSYFYLSESKKLLKARVKSIFMSVKKQHPK